MSYEPFTALCIALAFLYIAVGMVSFYQLIKIQRRDDWNIGTCYLWCSGTVQEQIHLVIFILCTVRVGFFFVAIDAWNSEIGEVVSEKILFYSLNEFGTLLFFTLTSILALFWAELYHIATESIDFFTNIVRPATYLINIFAIIGASLCTYYVSISYSTDVDYVFYQYTILAATAYFLAALMFAYYAYLADVELKQVPIQLSMRQNRLLFLRILGFICISALLIQALVLIFITGQTLETSTAAQLTAMFLYFFILEIVPLCVILAYYRVENLDDLDDNDEDSETTPLSQTPMSDKPGNPKFNTPVLRSLPKYSPKSAPNAVVDAIIARLSDTDSAVGSMVDSSASSAEVGGLISAVGGGGESTDRRLPSDGSLASGSNALFGFGKGSNLNRS